MGTRFLAVLLSAAAAMAQDWEIGAATGYGVYRNASVYAPDGKVKAGIRNRFVAGAVFCEDLYEHISGEFRYTYQDGDPFVSAGGVQSNVQGQSHAFHYDVLFHFRDRDARVRPYVAAGVGAKLFVVTGPPPLQQPLGNIATLSTEDDWRPLFTGGAGVKVLLAPHVILRVDFRDYITPFPKRLIVPAPFGTGRGFLQQFTPLVGLSYRF